MSVQCLQSELPVSQKQPIFITNEDVCNYVSTNTITEVALHYTPWYTWQSKSLWFLRKYSATQQTLHVDYPYQKNVLLSKL